MDGDNDALADIDHDLHRIFTQHPDSHLNDAGDPVIPADALVDVFQAFADIYNGFQLLSSDEMDMLKALLASNPGLEVTPQILMDFIAEKTKHAHSRSPADDNVADQDAERPPEDPSSDGSNGSIGIHANSHSRPPSRGGSTKYSPFDAESRQRTQPLTTAPSSWNSRRPPPASRRKSIDAGSRSDSESFSTSPNVFHRSSGRRSRAPSNPTSPTFSYSGPFSPIGSPAPPTSFHGLSFSGSGSYSRPSSRNAHHSHSSSQPTLGSFQFGSPSASSHMDDSYYRSGQSTPDESLSRSASSLYDYHGRRLENSFVRSTSGRSSVSPLPASATNLDGGILDHRNDLTSADLSDMSGSSSDEEEDSVLGLVMDKTVNASTASLEPIERMDALQRANTELGRKLLEAEGTLQRKLLEHESELEEMQSRLDDMRAELAATKREEKELRSKERQNTTQIAALEAEIAKVTRALDHARVTYTSLQKQYQEQCLASEKYRDDLRIREDVIRMLRDAATTHEHEEGKWAREQESYEERIAHLEAELTVAQQAHVQLDEQKQENLLLKETIDRMRFEMDEMRSGLNLGLYSGTLGLPGSGRGTISKSLGDELVGKLKWEDDDPNASRESTVGDEDEEEEGSSFNSETAVELDGESGEEDVIQTIITKRKRKIASRANKTEVLTQLFEESKDYSDSSTQYDPSYFFSTGSAQTDLEPERPKVTTASVDTQTEEPSHPPPSPDRTEFAIQVDLVEEMKVNSVAIDASVPDPPPRVMIETDVQTEGAETDDHEEQEHYDSLASSSSTIKPPTPRPITPAPGDARIHHDEPPAYSSATSAADPSSIALGLDNEEIEWRMAAELLKKWHRGAKLPIDGVPGGVSEEAVEEWRTLKEELGVECMVIDKIMERSAKVPAVARPPPGEEGATETDSATSSTQGTVLTSVSRAGRFYNIYNTYVYGAGSGVHHHHGEDGKPSTSSSFPASLVVSTLTSLARQAAMWAGASAALLFFMGPYLAPAPYGAGPTYFDLQAWNSFNALHAGAGEGFVGPAGRFGGGWFGFGAGAGGVAGAGAVDGTAAVWNILGRVGGGAARIARGWPT
ncbi:hypothetical protein AX14_002010 [Amanita brunnescens Koide BX004]|nr:hypothetical protein AX14_002010 [Amanita brunnescens Koide BX004]